MKAKWLVQAAGLVVILALVLGTAGYYLTHPDQRGQDVRGHGHQRPHE